MSQGVMRGFEVKNEIFFGGFGNPLGKLLYLIGLEWFQFENGFCKKVGLNPPGGIRYFGKGDRMARLDVGSGGGASAALVFDILKRVLPQVRAARAWTFNLIESDLLAP